MRVTAFILLLVVGVWSGALAQDCCQFDLIRKDTTLKQSSISVIEVPQGKQAVIKFEDRPVIVTIREDFTTVGAWTNATNTADPFLNKTVSFSNTKDASLFMNFFGRRVEIVTATAPHHGSAIVQVNQLPEETISFYSATRNENVTVFAKDVPEGTNTIKIKVAGNGYVVVDYFKIFQ